MLVIRRNDTVILADYANGTVLDIIRTEVAKVYKIKKSTDNQIIYVDDKLVRLSKQCVKNLLVTRSIEIGNFLFHALKCW